MTSLLVWTLRKSSQKVRSAVSSLLRSPQLAAAVLLAVYLFILFILPEGGYYLGDQGVKFTQVDALVRRHSLAVGGVTDFLSVFRPEFSRFYVQVKDSYYSVFSPMNALTGAPFYLAFGLRGLVIPTVLGSLLAAYGVGVIGRTIGLRYPGFAVLVVGLASPMLFYAFVFSEHPLSVALATAAVYLLLTKRPIAAGISLALAIWFRPEIMILLPALVISIFLTDGWRSGTQVGMRLVAGFLLAIVPWWMFNYSTFGFPFGPQVELNGVSLGRPLTEIAVPFLPMGPRKWIALITLVLVATLFVVSRRSKAWLVTTVATLFFGVALINALNFPWYLKGTAPSLIDVFPFVLVSLLSLANFNGSSHVRFLWIVVVVFLFGVTVLSPTWGGGGWGQRLLLLVFPLLGVLGCVALENRQQPLIRASSIVLVLSSLAVQLAGMKALSSYQSEWTYLQRELISLEPPVVATAVWWLPQVAAPTAQHLEWYGIYKPEDIERLVSRHKCFWWIWSDEPQTLPWESPLHNSRSLPSHDLVVVETKRLSTRNLEALHYCCCVQ